eukprot:CAMPEP_0168797098 /NCGR_PEP_ID=MMETSP0725-20121227/17134_1 /TAXON_ID=265536 /ORGANISM="Amphiprora sp., Strain CCMP467" /LENGTH=55 /DNA_ID=CAMNT_0008848311 /DNA_START=53 /DNA_END=216 /DNA_ORIENTATION=+
MSGTPSKCKAFNCEADKDESQEEEQGEAAVVVILGTNEAVGFDSTGGLAPGLTTS